MPNEAIKIGWDAINYAERLEEKNKELGEKIVDLLNDRQKTVADIIEDIDSGTLMTNGNEQWIVCYNDAGNKYLAEYSANSCKLSTQQCSLVSIPDLRPLAEHRAKIADWLVRSPSGTWYEQYGMTEQAIRSATEGRIVNSRYIMIPGTEREV